LQVLYRGGRTRNYWTGRSRPRGARARKSVSSVGRRVTART
jgi:hypothetical protein